MGIRRAARTLSTSTRLDCACCFPRLPLQRSRACPTPTSYRALCEWSLCARRTSTTASASSSRHPGTRAARLGPLPFQWARSPSRPSRTVAMHAWLMNGPPPHAYAYCTRLGLLHACCTRKLHAYVGSHHGPCFALISPASAPRGMMELMQCVGASLWLMWLVPRC